MSREQVLCFRRFGGVEDGVEVEEKPSAALWRWILHFCLPILSLPSLSNNVIVVPPKGTSCP